MVLPRCEVCDEEIQRGKEKFVPPAMAGPNRVTMFVHANPRECKAEKMPQTNKHECPRQGCASSTTVLKKLGNSWGTLSASRHAQLRDRSCPEICRVC